MKSLRLEYTSGALQGMSANFQAIIKVQYYGWKLPRLDSASVAPGTWRFKFGTWFRSIFVPGQSNSKMVRGVSMPGVIDHKSPSRVDTSMAFGLTGSVPGRWQRSWFGSGSLRYTSVT